MFFSLKAVLEALRQSSESRQWAKVDLYSADFNPFPLLAFGCESKFSSELISVLGKGLLDLRYEIHKNCLL